MAYSEPNGQGPYLSGLISHDDLSKVIDFYNSHYPGFNFNYGTNLSKGMLVKADHINDFFNALASCNGAWNGESCLPQKRSYSRTERITPIQFGLPRSNFTPVYGREFFVGGNGKPENQYVVPAGCRYMHLQWIIAGGGRGGDGSGWFETNGSNSSGGGSGAWVKDTWVAVEQGDIITMTVGQSGGMNGNDNGGISRITVYRPSLGRSFTIFEVTGGTRGTNNSNWYASYLTTSAGGVVNAMLGWNGSVGSHAPWNRQSIKASKHSWIDDGQPGASSPLGEGGKGGGACKNCTSCCPASGGTGYGSGGGSGGYFDDG